MGALDIWTAVSANGEPQGSVVVEMNHYRNAKLQLETTGIATYEVQARIVGHSGQWSAPIHTGTVESQWLTLVEVNTHFPQLLLSWTGNTGLLTVYICLSERMEN